ncbi:extensin, partial [Streptomyces turgidiscabies]|uniref:extensin n=3 Tax=Streptomyces TaxID=1883 RepID=UPI0031E1075F
LSSAHPLTTSLPAPPRAARPAQALPVAPKAAPLRRSAPPVVGQPVVTPVRHSPASAPLPAPVSHSTGAGTPVQRGHAPSPTPPRPAMTGAAPAQPVVPAAPSVVRIQRRAAPAPQAAQPATQAKSRQTQQAEQTQQTEWMECEPPPPFEVRELNDHQLDELTHRLIDRVTRKVRTELRLDRERIGKLRDPRR